MVSDDSTSRVIVLPVTARSSVCFRADLLLALRLTGLDEDLHGSWATCRPWANSCRCLLQRKNMRRKLANDIAKVDAWQRDEPTSPPALLTVESRGGCSDLSEKRHLLHDFQVDRAQFDATIQGSSMEESLAKALLEEFYPAGRQDRSMAAPSKACVCQDTQYRLEADDKLRLTIIQEVQCGERCRTL